MRVLLILITAFLVTPTALALDRPTPFRIEDLVVVHVPKPPECATPPEVPNPLGGCIKPQCIIGSCDARAPGAGDTPHGRSDLLLLA